MKLSELDMKKNFFIEQLHKRNFYQTEGLTYNELKHKLATIKAMEIDISKDENKFF
ncbi:hypothetical protein [Ornithinibacillus xuwenensis]|uniref:Fur-regulated basic protein FbpA n=1 Tax=Ornithinibacillus xuwenensis TaxID=3144668 RepID=A0ABU9XF21_9BACI